MIHTVDAPVVVYPNYVGYRGVSVDIVTGKVDESTHEVEILMHRIDA